MSAGRGEHPPTTNKCEQQKHQNKPKKKKKTNPKKKKTNKHQLHEATLRHFDHQHQPRLAAIRRDEYWRTYSGAQRQPATGVGKERSAPAIIFAGGQLQRRGAARRGDVRSVRPSFGHQHPKFKALLPAAAFIIISHQRRPAWMEAAARNLHYNHGINLQYLLTPRILQHQQKITTARRERRSSPAGSGGAGTCVRPWRAIWLLAVAGPTPAVVVLSLSRHRLADTQTVRAASLSPCRGRATRLDAVVTAARWTDGRTAACQRRRCVAGSRCYDG